MRHGIISGYGRSARSLKRSYKVGLVVADSVLLFYFQSLFLSIFATTIIMAIWYTLGVALFAAIGTFLFGFDTGIATTSMLLLMMTAGLELIRSKPLLTKAGSTIWDTRRKVSLVLSVHTVTWHCLTYSPSTGRLGLHRR